MNETVNTETDVSAEPDTEVEVKQDDMDSLLSEWDDKPEESAKAPTQPPAQDPMVLEMYREMVERDLDKAVDRVYENLGDMSRKPNRSMIRNWMEGKATRDSRLNKAFTQRRNNPTGWDKIVDGLTGEFKTQFDVEEESTTDDRVAAEAFVRGSSTTNVPKPDVSEADLAKMSDAEFNAHTRKEYGV